MGVERFVADCFATAGCDQGALEDCLFCAEQYDADCPEVAEADYDAYSATQIECLVGPDSGCPDSAAASSETGAAAYTGTTDGGGDDFEGSCGYCDDDICFGPAADYAIEWTAASAGTFVIDTLGTDFDTILYVLDACAGEELACNDDADGEAEVYQSSVEVTVEAAQTVIIVVDGWSASEAGDFVVNINPA
jgi:hypothetical protein